MATTVLVAPAGRGVGLTSACLGIVRALERHGIPTAFVKPIANRDRIHTAELLALTGHAPSPASITRAEADELLAQGDDQLLMEHVVEIVGAADPHAEVLVVEGLTPETGMIHSSRVNALMMKALDAELVFVASPRDETPEEIASVVAIAARGYGALTEGSSVGCILNRVCCGTARQTGAEASETIGPAYAACGGCPGGADLGEMEAAYRSALEAEGLRPLAIVPCNADLASPRVQDVARALDARFISAGRADVRRVRDVAICAGMVPTALTVMRPGTLLLMPGDRNDVLLAAALSVQDGVPLAGVVLTAGLEPPPSVLNLCKKALQSGLPLLAVKTGSYRTATAIASMDSSIPTDDGVRVERTMNYVADRVDAAWARGFSQEHRVPRLSPPAFRHRLVEAARADVRRIVLPEGTEPRTVAAAAIVAQRGIANCVLLGDPDEVAEVAHKQGITLPSSVQVIDPTEVAGRYVAPLVERRKNKGMTPERAVVELQDPIVVGTMMLALDEADGLVSGATHSTAHTIRPALQIIKTAPGCTLVSSVFFMCLPDQVLVFGDCAVVPNPTAEELADIALQSAESAIAFGIPARVAMLSYSTGTSGTGEDVEKVLVATRLAQQRRPDLAIDGPLQYDAAVMPDVARLKAPGSKVAGQATVLVFPDLNTGNVTYKAVQRSANVVSMGPMLQGLAKPVNDLSRGCLVEDIVFTINLTAIQAQATRQATLAGARG
ncbi:MAG: phosphate acetyltransferase [Vicinamibacterales bacterium]|nr:phosphate acetyltransferase [Vicinamibacterales bacterium]